MAEFPAIRVTQYRVGPDEFTGTLYTLVLDRPLLRNYFVMISPAADGNTLDAATVVPKVSRDPFGTGDLVPTVNDNELQLFRGTTSADWVGTIQVVECERDPDVNGFRLLDVIDALLPASTGTGVQTTTRVARTEWKDIDQVVLFAGWRGGGARVLAVGQDKYPSSWARVFPSGDDVVSFERFEDVAAGSALVNTDMVAYVVEWGSAWDVQRVTITGANFGNGSSVGHWNTQTITSVTRVTTWLYANGYTEHDGPAEGFAGTALALGDGVTENAAETEVAANWQLDPGGSSLEVYVVSHPSLVVEWFNEPRGRAEFSTFNTTVAEPLTPQIRRPGDVHARTVDETTGRRLAVNYTSSANASNGGYPAAIGWFPSYTDDLVLNIVRPEPSAPSAWLQRLQSIDLGAVVKVAEDVVAGTLPTPTEDPPVSTTGLVLIPDHAAKAIDDLIGELRQPRISALAEAMATGVQVSEDLTFELIVDRMLDVATGDALDQYGENVGEPRGGLSSDPEYRRFIRARIAANESGGSTDELIQIWRIVTGPSISVLETPLYPAGFQLVVVREAPLSDEAARRVRALMEDAKPSGISMILIEAVVGYFGFITNPDAEPLDVGLLARSL